MGDCLINIFITIYNVNYYSIFCLWAIIVPLQCNPGFTAIPRSKFIVIFFIALHKTYSIILL